MKRFDRAMYGIFLLVLLADVARVRAAVPVEGDSGLILRAASRMGESPAGVTALDRRRVAKAFPSVASFKRISQRLSSWTRDLSEYPGPVLVCDAASDSAAVETPPLAVLPSLRIFEHGGSPAP
jgi:hypothetical protein